jgi:hypothetical protein
MRQIEVAQPHQDFRATATAQNSIVARSLLFRFPALLRTRFISGLAFDELSRLFGL